MGVKNLPMIAERLAAAGRDPAEPAAAIERGTLPGQRTVTATLAELPAAVAEAGLGAPAILLFGAVAARRDSIAWIERRPLWGRTVVVTRARAQASGLAATLRDLGAEVSSCRRSGSSRASTPTPCATRSPTCTATRWWC